MKSTLPIYNTQNTINRHQKPVCSFKNSSFQIFTREEFQKYDTEVIYQPDEANVAMQPQPINKTINLEETNQFQEIKNDLHHPEEDTSEPECEDHQCQPQNELISHFQYDSDSIYYVKNLKCQCESLSDEYIKKLIINQRKIKKPITKKKNAVTKNLPSFFLRQFFRVINQSKLSDEDRKLFIKFENSDCISKASIKKLKEFISVPAFQKVILKYLQSYQYIDDVLNSEKILDVTIPIKFLRHIYQACLQPDDFTNWAD